MKNITEILSTLTDDELLIVYSEMKSTSISEDALVRTIVLEAFGEIDILVLQLQLLMWPLLEETITRFKSYSPHIQK